MAPESINLDLYLFVSYSGYDNRDGHTSEIVVRIQKEHRDFTGEEELWVFFEKDDISGYDR